VTPCPHCHGEVPEAPFCIRCGEPLQNRLSPYPVEGRGYAASPSERWFWPRVVSSIFPHLPHGDMRSFRVAFAIGTAAIVGLSAFDLFSLALVTAAVVVPFLSILYLWDVDLYEDEPLPVLGATAAWGVVAGVALGLVTRHLASPLSLLSGHASRHSIIWLGVVLPAVSFLLMLLGPLALLPYRRFNDVLDGVTFGAASAVTFLAAEALTNSADVLREGLTAPGDQGLWIARLLTLGVAVPVLGAGAVGAAAGVLWLRFRAPSTEGVGLGPIGKPAVALPAAAVALVAAHLSAVYLRQWGALAVTTLLAAGALVVLRRIIDLGLRQESAEREIGPAIRCPNCGRDTPTHTFCAHCGTALRALPKSGAAVPHAPQPTGTRISRLVLPAVFAALVAATIGISLIVIELVQPAPVSPPCQPGRPCGAPPRAAQALLRQNAAAPAFESGTRWTSAVGVAVHYDTDIWKVQDSTSQHLVLAYSGKLGDVVAAIIAVPSSKTPQQLLDAQLAAQKGQYLGFERDDSAGHVLLGAEIGFVPAIAAMYKATVDQSLSPSQRIEFAFEVATKRGATVLVEALADEAPKTSDPTTGASSPFPTYELVNELMDTFEWAPGV